MDEMIGRKFGRWMVKEYIGKSESYVPLFKCECECGTIRNVSKYKLLNGTSKSCDCLKNDLHALKIGAKHSCWKGGKHLNDAGYVMIHKPEFHRTHNGYAREHIVIAEKVLGKRLPEDACVHHYGDTKDNSKLVICQDHTYHMFLHARTRAFNASGNVNYRKCKYCKKYDDPVNMFVSNTNSGIHYHRKCHNKYQKDNRR